MAPALTFATETTQSEPSSKSIPLKAVGPADSIKEDYNGQYTFAPIEEAQVSRAMIKRLVFVDIQNLGFAILTTG